MNNSADFNIVVAEIDANGKSSFVDRGPPVSIDMPGIIAGTYVWSTVGPPQIPGNIGSVPSEMSLPKPGDTRFGIMTFPPRSAGKLDMNGTMSVDDVVIKVDEYDHGLHRTASIDYEVVISGKVDITLEGGETRTLTPGTWLVMAGATHVWQNIYDEPCVCALFIVGAENKLPA